MFAYQGPATIAVSLPAAAKHDTAAGHHAARRPWAV